MDTTTLDSAAQIAADVRAGHRSARDVAHEHLARIAELDPALNAFQTVRASGALADAAAVDADPRRADLPLAGVPVAVKDNTAVAGEPVRLGSAATSAEPSHEDDVLVARLRRAGAVVVGTTRMPELAIWGFTSSVAHGPTRNPLDPRLDPGGSSGGAAAAVAAGMAALAVGTDGGGSIRIPSAYCGLVGLKPTRDAVPLPGGVAEHWLGLTVAGPIARSASDARLLFEVLTGAAVTSTTGPLRVATSTASPNPLGRPGPHQRAAVTIAAERLAEAGHVVTPARLRYPATLLNQWTRVWLAGVAEEADRLGLDPDRLEPRTRTMVRKGRRVRRTASSWPDRAAALFAEHDVLVTPVTARDAGPAGEHDGRGYLATYLAAGRSVPFTPAWNLAGFPAISVPVGSADGRPLAAQLVGRPGTDGVLLALAEQIAR